MGEKDFFFFKTRSHIASAGLKLSMQLKITLISQPSHLQLGSEGIVGHAIVPRYVMLGMEPRPLCMLANHFTHQGKTFMAGGAASATT